MTERRLLLPIRGADPETRPPPGLDLATVKGDPADPITPVIERSTEGSHLLLFGGVDQLRRWRDPARFIAAPEEALFDLARRLRTNHIVLDIAGPVRQRLECSPDGEGIDHGPPFDLRGLGGPLTVQACARVRTELARERGIQAAWVVEATVDQSSFIVLALLVDADGDRDRLAGSLMRSVMPLLPLDLYEGSQIVLLDDPSVSAAVERADAPLYRRDERSAERPSTV